MSSASMVAGSSRVLIVDVELSTPPSDGGTRAVHDLARTLVEVGYAVDIAETLDAVDSLTGLGATWSAVFLSRPSAAVPLARSIRRHVSGPTIYLGHDLHFRRLAADPDSAAATSPVRVMRSVEEWCWRNTDVTLYPNPDEVDYVNRVVGRGAAEFFPYFRVDTVTTGRRAGVEGAVLLGGSGHRPNVAGLEWLVSNVLAGAPVPVSQLQIQVVGSWDQRLQSRLASPTVSFTGWLSQSALHDQLLSAKVMIVPLTFGAGLKSKVIDALAAGLPVVTTPVGVQGIPAADEVAFVGATREAWWTHLGTVLADVPEVSLKVQAAGRYALRRHGPAAYRRRLTQVLAYGYANASAAEVQK